MARSLGLLYAAGATMALATVALSHTPRDHVAGVAATATLGYPPALLLLLAGGRLPRWALHALLAAGAVLISVGGYFAGVGTASTTAAMLYVWVSVFAFYFFQRREALAHLGVIGAAYALLLGIQGVPAAVAQWCFVLGTSFVVGAMVGSLVAKVRAVAGTDSLTGLPNRRAWEEALARECARSARLGTPLCVGLLDLDGFKGVNDEAGHQGGDRILKELAAAWSQALRANDILARYGGDEFALIFPDCEPEQAAQILARLRAAAPEHPFSVGLAPLRRDRSPDDLVGDADAALYGAKRTGRARVVAGTTTLDLREPAPDRQWHPIEIPAQRAGIEER
jgi:diguanylate cyclase (GGDEF)-like protein